MSYKVMTFKKAVNTKSEGGLPYISEGGLYRDYLSLGENLSWEEAKTMRRENRGSWIVKQ